MTMSPTAIGPSRYMWAPTIVFEPSALVVCSLKMMWKLSPMWLSVPLIRVPAVGLVGMLWVLVTSPVFGSVDVSTKPLVTVTVGVVVEPLRWHWAMTWGITSGPGPALMTVDRLRTDPLPAILPWLRTVSDPLLT